MPFIENIAAVDAANGRHRNPGTNSMLISICDPCGWRPEAEHQFAERHDFEFLDIDSRDIDRDPAIEEFAVTDDQAKRLVELLRHAQDEGMNVIVHCTAGICRSGAVTEVGVMLGFDECSNFRAPNLRVKHKMMQVLGWTYEADEAEDVEAQVKKWMSKRFDWEGDI